MGSSTSKKPNITISAIRTNTEDIRSSLKRKQISSHSKENIHQVLINNSKQLDTLRPKKSKKKQLEIDQLQKLVSDVSEELLQYNDDHLDKSADESHSFIHVGADQMKETKKQPTVTPQMKKSSKTRTTLSISMTNLNEIEQKLAKVKHDVTVAIKNDDRTVLLFQKKKIEMLSTDLELLNIPEKSPLNEKKQILEKDLYRYYQKIIRREKNQARLSRINIEEDDKDIKMVNTARLKSLEIMIQDIHDVLQNTLKGDNRGNMKELHEELIKIEVQLNDINDNSKENLKSKTLLIRKVEETKKFIKTVIHKREMNELDELMDEIDKLKMDIQSEHEEEKVKIFKELTELRDKLKSSEVTSQENEVFREEYLSELNDFLEKTNLSRDEVKMREKKLKISKSVEDLINLQEEWTKLEQNISLIKGDELKKVDEMLGKFEESIRVKRESLANLLKKSQNDNQQGRKSDEVIRTSVKIYELPKMKTTKSTENIKPLSKSVDTITPKKYSTLEHEIEEVTKISNRVDEIGKDILKFQGTSEDLEYNFFRASLSDKKLTLQNLTLKSSWPQIDVLKSEILEKITYLEDYLEYKLNQNILGVSLTEKLNDLDKKIRKFEGSYQNLQFTRIFDEISSCSRRAESIDSNDLREKIQNRSSYLKMLLKEIAQTDIELIPNENLTDTNKLITENKEYLRKLKEMLEKTSTLPRAEYEYIEKNLNFKVSELINLNVGNDTPKFQDIKELLQDIDYCRKFLINLKLKQEVHQREICDFIRNDLKRIEYEILNFDGLSTDQIYLDLMKDLSDLELKFNALNQTDTTENTSELGLTIKLLLTKLEQIGLESGIIFEIENRVSKILDTISNGVPENDYDILDEELINLKIQLERLTVSEKLSYRKITCLNYIEYLLKKVNEGKNDTSEQVSRSVVV